MDGKPVVAALGSSHSQKLEELGLSPQAVLRQAGLRMALFSQEKILVSTEEFVALYRGIAEAADDPGFGLKLGHRSARHQTNPSLTSDVPKYCAA
ncbi:MAG: AraC family transcriptional regulator ligand-binding domain-containing protein [Candidatus Acidiferrales bacterium]